MVLMDSSPWKTQDHRGDCCGNLVGVAVENSNLPSGAKNLSGSTHFERDVKLVAQAIILLEQERLCSATTNGKSGRARNAITANGPDMKLNKAVDQGRVCRIRFH
ncbi:hypothetical protein BOTCAL_0026g00340 [Botryotinia calthae]|uniref:Uncharacterized protein n=1 Tax=Botryotinia calthae TaxID=38488 RepID=A0A4Y8DGB5_9HELO|nr:hypothetical protein BOTCAL_0026g00340 [Botryotinia calthae]